METAGPVCKYSTGCAAVPHPDSIEKSINALLENCGIPTVGIASAASIPGVPEDFSPLSLLKGASSVICFTVPVPRGIVFSQRDSRWIYWRYCGMGYRRLDAAADRLSIFLEQEGFLACPVYSCFPWKRNSGKYWGTVPLVYWAERAGLGRLTRSGLLGSRRHGTLLLVGGVVTSVPLEPHEMSSEDLCPENCTDCQDVCPVDAIDPTGRVDHRLCLRHANSSPLLSHLAEDESIRSSVSIETLLNTTAVDDHSSYECLECLKACPLNIPNG